MTTLLIYDNIEVRNVQAPERTKEEFEDPAVEQFCFILARIAVRAAKRCENGKDQC